MCPPGSSCAGGSAPPVLCGSGSFAQGGQSPAPPGEWPCWDPICALNRPGMRAPWVCSPNGHAAWLPRPARPAPPRPAQAQACTCDHANMVDNHVMPGLPCCHPTTSAAPWARTPAAAAGLVALSVASASTKMCRGRPPACPAQTAVLQTCREALCAGCATRAKSSTSCLLGQTMHVSTASQAQRHMACSRHN
jgi:hypothetical protein